MRRGGWWLTVTAVVTALALGACGNNSRTTNDNQQPAKPADNGVAAKSAREILDAATAAFRSASSVHLVGKIEEEGGTVRLDLRLGQSVAQGTITMNGAKLRILRSGVRLYLRGRDFWEKTLGPQGGNLIGDRWVLAPRTGSGGRAFAGLVKFTLLNGFADQVLDENETLTKGGASKVDGKPAVALKNPEGDTLWVATTGTPYPLRLEPGKPKAGERLDLREYNAPVRPASPPVDALDLGKLPQNG